MMHSSRSLTWTETVGWGSMHSLKLLSEQEQSLLAEAHGVKVDLWSRTETDTAEAKPIRPWIELTSKECRKLQLTKMIAVLIALR